MKFKFLSFVIGMALVSTGVNAETLEENLEVKGATVLDSTLNVYDDVYFSNGADIKGETFLNTLKITIPKIQINKAGDTKRPYNYFIRCYDQMTPAYSEMFSLTYKGHMSAVKLTLSESAVNHTYTPKLNCSYVDSTKSWVFCTNSYPGRYYGLNFKAEEFVFDEGDMVVNGKITCKEELNVVALNASNIKAADINVNMNNAADYVFGEDYDLKSLSEVEAYIKENKHLPGIPSAAEMEQNGVSVSAMSNMLLEKVEELTLHMIRLEKENAALKAEVELLRK